MKPSISLSSIVNENEKLGNDDASDASFTIEELMSVLEASPQDDPVDQSSMACYGSLCSSKDTLHTSTMIAISPHELCRRIVKEQQREAQQAQAGKMRVSNDMPTLEDYISMTRQPDNDSSGNIGIHHMSAKPTGNRHRKQSFSVGEVSDLSSHPSSHPSLSTRENESVSLFENSIHMQKTDTIPQTQIRPLEPSFSFTGEQIGSHLKLFATDMRCTQPALDFLGNDGCDKSMGLETSLSDLFDRSKTAMFIDDITQSELIGDAKNRSVGLQRSQSELFARGTMTSNRRRRSNSARVLQSPRVSRTKNASPTTRKQLQSLNNTIISRRVSPCLQHDSETTNRLNHYDYLADGYNDKHPHKHRRHKQTIVGDVAAGKTKRDKEHSTQNLKKAVAESWKTDDDTLVGESHQSASKVRSRKTDTILHVQKSPLEAPFTGEKIGSQLELVGTDTRGTQPAFDFLGNDGCDKSIGLETSLSVFCDRSKTAMFFDDITQSELIGDAKNRSVGLQRSQSELFARGTMTSNRRRRSNSARELQSPRVSRTKNASPTTRTRLQSLNNTKMSHRVSPCLQHDSETTNRLNHFGYLEDGYNDKHPHKHRPRKQTIVGDVAAGKTKRDKERSTQNLKKAVAESWKTDDDTLVGESRQIASKVRSQNTKRRKSERRSRRSGKSRIDDKRNEWSQSKCKIGRNPNENKWFETETSGIRLKPGGPVENELDLVMYSSFRARKESDDFSAQTVESSLPTIWNDDPKCTKTDIDSSCSDGFDSDLSPRAPAQVRKLSDVGPHTLFSEPCSSSNWKGRKDVFDEGLGFSCTEDDCSSFEGDSSMNEMFHDSGVIIQFDANQEGHVCHIRPDMAKASWLQIRHGDGSFMEGRIFRMPETNNYDEETSDIAEERPVPSTRSSHRSSVREFLFRRQKSVRT